MPRYAMSSGDKLNGHRMIVRVNCDVASLLVHS
jgi:hypothetical protein